MLTEHDISNLYSVQCSIHSAVTEQDFVLGLGIAHVGTEGYPIIELLPVPLFPFCVLLSQS